MIRRDGSQSVLDVEMWLPYKPHELFPFYADAFNLEVITPPWLNFHVLTPRPIDMHAGTLIDYRLRVHGLPVRWRTLIEAWEPPLRFVDTMVRGPYQRWWHEHTFIEHEGGTIVRDHVEFRAPLRWLTHRLFVERDVATIFDYRKGRLRELFGERPEPQPSGPLQHQRR
mgnify:CR=1 FL=1